MQLCNECTQYYNLQKGKQVLTALGNTKGGRLISAILNVEEAGVYSESRSDAFQVFLAQSSNYSYLSILFFWFVDSNAQLSVNDIPMQPPSAEVDANGMYFLLSLLTCSVVGFAMEYNFQSFFPEIKLGFVSLLFIGLTFGSTLTASIYALGHAIAFPIPFAGSYHAVPAIMAMFGMALLIARKQIPNVKNFLKRFVDYAWCMLVVDSSIMLFPDPIIVALIAMSFPILKLIRYRAYQVVQRSSAHLDLASKMCIFTVDFLAHYIYQ